MRGLYCWSKRAEQVRIHNSKAIKQFIAREPKAKAPLKFWQKAITDHDWDNGADLLQTFNSADCVADNKWVFNIGGNNYRLAAMVWFESKVVFVLKVMTHSEYDKEMF
jgi:mRNA interferase HigB